MNPLERRRSNELFNIYFHDADRGGHFAMWEHPQLFSEEIRAAFRSLR
jgi:pimeloyl-ACP methyl ester carboxylesterase